MRNMKKYITLLFILLSLTSCTSDIEKNRALVNDTCKKINIKNCVEKINFQQNIEKNIYNTSSYEELSEVFNPEKYLTNIEIYNLDNFIDYLNKNSDNYSDFTETEIKNNKNIREAYYSIFPSRLTLNDILTFWDIPICEKSLELNLTELQIDILFGKIKEITSLNSYNLDDNKKCINYKKRQKSLDLYKNVLK